MDQARKELLLKLSHILRSRCYNGHIQNYARWGEWEGEGRWFTYPQKYVDESSKRVSAPANLHLQSDELLRALHCAFGANCLFLIRGLEQALDYLEEHHGLTISDFEVEQRLAAEKAAEVRRAAAEKLEKERREQQARLETLAQMLRESPDGGPCQELLAVAQRTEYARKYSVGNVEEAKASFDEAARMAAADLSSKGVQATESDVASAADLALAQAEKERFERLLR